MKAEMVEQEPAPAVASLDIHNFKIVHNVCVQYYHSRSVISNLCQFAKNKGI